MYIYIYSILSPVIPLWYHLIQGKRRKEPQEEMIGAGEREGEREMKMGGQEERKKRGAGHGNLTCGSK
jgi:hypothetical protein